MLPTHVLNGIAQFSSDRSTNEMARSSRKMHNDIEKNRLKVVDSVVFKRLVTYDVNTDHFEAVIKCKSSQETVLYNFENPEECVGKMGSLAPKHFEFHGDKTECVAVIENLGIEWLAKIRTVKFFCKTDGDYLQLVKRIFDVVSRRGAVKQIGCYNFERPVIVFKGEDDRILKLFTENPVVLNALFLIDQLKKLEFTKFPSFVLFGEETVQIRQMTRLLYAIGHPRSLMDSPHSFYITINGKPIKIAQGNGYLTYYKCLFFPLLYFFANLLASCFNNSDPAWFWFCVAFCIVTFACLLFLGYHLIKECRYLGFL